MNDMVTGHEAICFASSDRACLSIVEFSRWRVRRNLVDEQVATQTYVETRRKWGGFLFSVIDSRGSAEFQSVFGR